MFIIYFYGPWLPVRKLFNTQRGYQGPQDFCSARRKEDRSWLNNVDEIMNPIEYQISAY